MQIAVTTPQKNSIATAGFVLALVGAVLSFIPFVNWLGFVLAIVGLILAIVGLTKVKTLHTGKGLGIAAIILAAFTFIMVPVITAATLNAIEGAPTIEEPPAAATETAKPEEEPAAEPESKETAKPEPKETKEPKEADPVEKEKKPEAPAETMSQQQARASAQDYLDYSAFSRQGLIDQLSSEYGESFPVKDAEYAVDSLDADWNEQAAKAAQDYLDYDSFSRQGLIDQLSSEYGDQYTVEQATYGVDQTGL
jgi:hypothetical protein